MNKNVKLIVILAIFALNCVFVSTNAMFSRYWRQASTTSQIPRTAPTAVPYRGYASTVPQEPVVSQEIMESQNPVSWRSWLSEKWYGPSTDSAVQTDSVVPENAIPSTTTQAVMQVRRPTSAQIRKQDLTSKKLELEKRLVDIEKQYEAMDPYTAERNTRNFNEAREKAERELVIVNEQLNPKAPSVDQMQQLQERRDVLQAQLAGQKQQQSQGFNRDPWGSIRNLGFYNEQVQKVEDELRLTEMKLQKGTEAQRKQNIPKLKKEKADLEQRLQQMKATEAYEKANYPAHKAFSNADIRSTGMRKNELMLQKINSELSRKAPSKKEVELLISQKNQLEQEIASLRRKEENLRQYNPWKLSVDWEFVGGARENKQLQLNAINNKLQNYERLQTRRQAREKMRSSE